MASAEGTPSVIACGDATFPKGTASAVAAKFPAEPKASPRGMTSPAPGEDVTAGDKKGNLAANVVSRLRGYWRKRSAF